MRAEELLPDHINEARLNGVSIRKGTIGAFLVNASVILNPDAGEDERAQAYRDVEDAIPALQALGVFEIFQVRDPDIRRFIDQNLAPR